MPRSSILQVLAYMLASPKPKQPLFGMVTNGSNFVFLKLVQQNGPRYARSNEFILEQGDDLYTVLRVLKQLAGVVSK